MGAACTLQHHDTHLERWAAIYSGKHVTVTGGASFIGSHLVDALVELDATVTIVDDFSSGAKVNVNKNARLIEADLRNLDKCKSSLADAEVIFHLAAIHGGRGFIESQEAAMTANLAIDQNVFSASAQRDLVVHASSACAYPINLQSAELDRALLQETDADLHDSGKSFPDGVYGWTKLIGEMQLERLSGTPLGPKRGRSARIFTAYGPRENESHAAVALIAKSLLQMEPFEVWGTGNQTRNFTFVADTAAGLLELGADQGKEKFDVYNIGTSMHQTINEFIDEIWSQIGWAPHTVNRDTSKPTGVGNRASDNSKFLSKFGWEPKIDIRTGLRETISWYRHKEDRAMSIAELEQKLMSR